MTRFSPDSHQEHPARQQSLTTATLPSPCSPATHTQDNLSFHYRTVLALTPPMAESSLFLSLSLSFILLRQQIFIFFKPPMSLTYSELDTNTPIPQPLRAGSRHPVSTQTNPLPLTQGDSLTNSSRAWHQDPIRIFTCPCFYRNQLLNIFGC